MDAPLNPAFLSGRPAYTPQGLDRLSYGLWRSPIAGIQKFLSGHFEGVHFVGGLVSRKQDTCEI